MHSLIIIPARFGSSRFPGKPLHMLAGKSMVQRVYELATIAKQGMQNIELYVATDNQQIFSHVEEFGGKAIMTPESCASGSDRTLAAIDALKFQPDYVINLQGDAPLTPVSVVSKMLHELQNSNYDVLTPVVKLSWKYLDELRKSKQTRPFSGTTAILNFKDEVIWFSKNIIPAIRKEQELRKTQNFSPVCKHIGLYAFKYSALQSFNKLTASNYEKLEGLEQLRLIENGFSIRGVKFNSDEVSGFQGVDTLEDANEVEKFLLTKEAL